MKIINWLFLVIAFVLAVSSCSENEAVREMLDKADSLLIGKSDSALILLDSYQAEKDSYCKSQRMRYEMLRALAQNTEDVLFTSDSILLEVVDYYESHGTDHDRMRANYALGCAYRDLGDAPRAIKYYNDAVSYADTTSMQCDYRTLSRIYGQMASVYHSQRVPRLELESEQNAVESSWKANDTIAALIFEEHMSDAFGLSREYDSVLYILDKVKREYEALGLNQMAARSVLNTIGILLDRDSLLEAKKRIDLYVNKSGYFDENGDIKTGLEHFYNNLGLYYEKTEQIDSAYFYYNKSLMNKISIPSKSIAYRGLLRIAMLKGNIEQVYEYAQRYSASKDTEVFLHSQEEITQAQALYNYTIYKEQSELEKIKSIRLSNIIIVTIVVSFFIIVFIVCCFWIKGRYVKNKLIANNIKYVNLLDVYNKSVSERQLLKDSFDAFITQKETEIEQLNSKLLSYHEDLHEFSNWQNDQRLLSDSAILDLHSLAAQGKFAPSGEILKVIEHLNVVNPKFKTFIENHKNLTEKESIICALIRLQFLPSEISVLLNASINSITNYRTSINKKLFNIKGTKGLEYKLISNT